MGKGRPRATHPTPGKRKRNNAWAVFWRADGQFSQLSVGSVSETEAEAARLRAAIALRTNDPDDWAKCPNAVQESDAVRRYMRRDLIADERDVLAVYESHIRPVLEADWATGSLAHLRFEGSHPN